MILIADSGSTKTSWQYINDRNESEIIFTQGINPFFRTTNDIVDELQKELSPKIDSSLSKIYFYGAGVINEEKKAVIVKALQILFPQAIPVVESDLLAAARASCGQTPGIVGILGTGSNSCYYDGEKIANQVSPLGFILGDEGSGAVLGKKLLADYLKGLLPSDLVSKFKIQFQSDYSTLMDHVYKKERPNKFLAQFVPFLADNIENNYCNQLIEQSFEEYIERNIKQYSNFKNLKIHFVGSIAYFFQTQLYSVLDKYGLNPGVILKDPMEKLTLYHLTIK